MGVLRFLGRLLSYIWRALAWILRGVFGNINWQSPPWLKAIGKGAGCASRKVASRKALSAIAIAGLIAIAGGSYAAYIWYENRPKPIDFAPTEITQASVYFYSPYKTDYSADKVVFNPLAISFSADVAPLDNVGKQVTQGATISPPIEGEWIWTSSERLTFTPSADWQIGQRYKVTLDPKTLIAADYGIDRREYEWTVAPFNYRRSTTELYQNPEKPSEKNAIFEFSFDYPVDAASFERALLMQLQAPDKYKISPKPFKFAVKYDDKKLRAWVRSEFVTFPEVDSYMVLSVAEGVKSSLGGDGTSAAANESLYVPSAYRAIVQNAFLTTVEGEDDEQTQALAISFVDGVDPKAIAREVRAWILPADHPFPNKARTRYFVTDYKWSAEDDITDEILALSQPLKLALGETEGGAQRLVSFKYAGDPNRYVYLTIGKNIVTVGGYKAKDALRYALRIPEFPKALKFAADGSLLSLKGERKIALAARNAAGFRLDIDRVIPSQLHHLLNFGYSHQGSLQEIQFSEYSRDYYVEGFTHLQPLPRTTSGKVIYSSVDLDRYLARSVKEPKGVFLLTLSAWNPDTNATESYGSGGRRLVIVSDLALIAKRAADGSGDLFAQSIKEGTPVEGVKISVIGRNGEPVASAVTDENGRARFNSLSHLERQGKEKSPTMYLAQKDDDSTFLPYGASAVDPFLNYSRFEVGGETDWPDKGKLQAYLFSDRGMYRPGENVHIASVVRALDWSVPFSGIPVVARVYDARGLEFTRREFRLDESGLNEFGFDTAADSPTGNWNIQLSVSPTYRDIKKAGVYLGETIVALREFEPDKTKVDIHLEPASKKGWLKPDELKAIIKAENLFGTPAENRRVASRAVLRPTAFGFKEYSGYSFYDSMTATNLFEFDLEETKTNQKGEASLPLINKEYGRASYQMALFAEVFEQGAGRSVTASVSAIVSPNDYLVGAKPDGDLGFIKKNTQRSLSFIAINPKLEKIKLNDLTLEIQEQKYISVLTLQDSGVYKYQSKLIEVSQGGKPFFIASGETVYKIDASKPGGYKLQVKNKSGDILYKAYYSVAGDANVDRSKERNAELELKLSKAEYKNGEEIELSIVAPYVGSGLITIEKDKVYAFKWFKTTTTSAIQTIKVPGDLVGNGYVNVQFVRDFNSDDIFVSPLSYAVAPFKVSTSDKTAAASIDAPKIVKPAQPIAVKLTTEGRHKAIVFGVDEGILQAAGYNFGNPLNFFFRKKALGVQSLQILDLILPEFSRFERLTSKPGGGDYAADAATKSRQLNPFQRKVEKPVAFWTGIIDIEDQKEFEWKTPDYFNGRLRVMALIVSAGKIGVAQTSVNVRDDFVITPNAPFTAAPGDEFIVTAGLSNNVEDLPEGEAVPIKLALSVNKNLEIIGDREVTLNVAPQRESFASFKVKAAQYLGGAELTFKASYAANGKTYSAQRIATTSIRPLVPLRAASQAKRMASGEESVKSDRDLYDAFAKRNAYFSRSPLILANALTSYLDNYPHYCSEQLVSGALAALIVEPYQKVLGGENAEVKLSRIEGVLQSRQNSRGAIGLWTTTYLGDQYITLYAAHYLIEAKERGKRINSSLLSAINDYMSGVASDGFGSVGDMHSLRMRAYAIYLLTRQKQVTTNYLNATLSAMKLHYAKTYEDDIAALYLAATYKLLKMDKEADALIQKQWDALSRAYTSAWWSRDYHDPLVVNAASVYIIGKHFPEKAADIPPQALENIVLALRQNRYTTHSAAWSALALDVFGSLNPLSEAPLTIEARNSAGQTRNIGKMEGAIVYGSFNGDDREIVFKNEGASAWYTVLQEGYERVLPKEPIKKGLEVYREYTDADGKKAGEITVGDVINVTIRVKALGSAAIGNAAIIDLLPGGFEIVPQTAERQSENGGEEEEYEEEGYDGGQSGYVSPFATSVSNFRLDYSDAREDRVLVYGEVGRETASFSYQIKATNAGTYETAPIFAEAMYDREIQALGLGNGKIVVKPAQ